MGIISGGRVIEGALPRDAVKTTIIAGGVAGAHTVTGIKTRDSLVSVLHLDMTDASETGADLTAEFSISAANTIDNTAGTATTGGFLVVTYLSAG
ncbi:MAG: hypothetical protein ACE5GS_15140 [Kiloniellaceae bacterium]